MKEEIHDRETFCRFVGRKPWAGALALSVALSGLAGCVGSDTSLGLNSVDGQQPLSKPVIAVLGDPQQQEIGTASFTDPGVQVIQDGVGVPVAAPRSTPPSASDTNDVVNTDVLAVAPEPTQPVAAATVIDQTTQIDPISQTETDAANAAEQKTQETVSADPAASGESIVPAEDVKPAPNTKKTGLLARLFGDSGANSARTSPRTNRTSAGRGDDDGVVRIASAHRTAKRASAKPASTRTTTVVSRIRSRNNGDINALPGVKSSAELFGINEAEVKDEIDSNNTQLAAVGGFGRLSPNGLRVQHEKVQVACLKPGVLRLLKMVERRYGSKPIITSGYRSPKRNRRAGGVRNSQHIFCKAVDIQVEGVSKWQLAKFLRTLPGRGGVGTYCRTKSVHIDIGPKREWHHPCRRSKVKKRKKA
ncbi:MAG: D-Ala-D-Ala carboxypeptidase family metallohydrolase [Pseudomonadota bacterium]